MTVYKAKYGSEYSILIKANTKDAAKRYCKANRLFNLDEFELVLAPKGDIMFADLLGTEIHDADAKPIEKIIVLTGAACGGKTTALAILTEYFESRGWKVIRIPEAATLLFEAGLRPGDSDSEQIAFQEMVVRTQMFLQDEARRMARTQSKPVLIICDRGHPEGKAFVPPHVWQAAVDQNHWSSTQLRDEPYGAVYILVTAADGAEEYYTLENNLQRTETPEQARKIDKLIQQAWQGHPHLRVIDNSTDFEGKMNRLLQEVCAFLGEPEPIEDERKFLLWGRPEIRVPHTVVSIEQDYLVPAEEGTEERVRRRGEGEHCVYFHTIKKPEIRSGGRPEIERIISPREYIALRARRDKNLSTVKKDRACFLYKGKYFEIDYYKEPEPFPNAVLEIEGVPHGDIDFPEWLEVRIEVTGAPGFSNYDIAAGVQDSAFFSTKNKCLE